MAAAKGAWVARAIRPRDTTHQKAAQWFIYVVHCC